MRLYLIATIDRIAGNSFQVKDETNKVLVGTMTRNGEKARHEMLLSETNFLKHNKALALLQRRLGFAVFVAGIIEPEAVSSPGEAFANMPFFTLRKLAKERGVDISKCKDNAERAAKINAAKLVAA